MASLLLECAIRAALIVSGTALVLWMLRIRRAAARHAAWAAVVLSMLALPLWSWGGPKLFLHVLQPAAAPTGAAIAGTVAPTIAPSMPDEALSEMTSSPETRRAPLSWPQVLLGLYLFGVVTLLVRLAIGTIYADRLRRSATAADGRATSDRCATPITIGWLVPTLILPSGWQAWPSAMLSAVLTHEREHARRRDPLLQWLALLNRALFWFHPLAWWLERRLAALAEESCDAVVLAAGHSPEAYADYLLDLARTVAVRGQRLRAVGMAMPGSGLKERMRLILDNASAAPISRVRVAATAVLCAVSTTLFAGATLTPRASSLLRAQPATNASQQPEGAIPKFDVVSIRPCDPSSFPPGARGGGGGGTSSPGRLHEDCQSLMGLIQMSYLLYANGRVNPPWAVLGLPVSGGPDWIKSDRYTVEATADGTPTDEMMHGPMTQAVLEDRFKLKMHRETREVPVYELSVAKSGSKLTPFKEGSCTPLDWTKFPPPPVEAGQKRCSATFTKDESGRLIRSAEGMSLAEFAGMFLRLDRPVIDKTGISGLVAFHLEFDAADPSSIFSAVKEQLGLELHPANGPRDFLVVDSAERPTPNDAPTTVAQVSQSTAAKTSFEAASIKPCLAGGDSGGRRGGGGINTSPGRLNVTCLTIAEIIGRAYVQFGDPRPTNAPSFLDPDAIKKLVSGGPGWIYTDRYTIEANTSDTSDTPTPTVMVGQMLRALLEDRLRLTLHQDQRQIPAYALTVATGGLKLLPADADSCRSADPNALGRATRSAPGEKPLCANGFAPHGPNVTWKATGVTLDQVARGLGGLVMDRPVIDRTGIAGQFTFEVEFVRDDSTSRVPAFPPDATVSPDAAAVPPGPSIFTVLERQLGLKLEPGQGPQGFLVVDHVERPSGG